MNPGSKFTLRDAARVSRFRYCSYSRSFRCGWSNSCIPTRFQPQCLRCALQTGWGADALLGEVRKEEKICLLKPSRGRSEQETSLRGQPAAQGFSRTPYMNPNLLLVSGGSCLLGGKGGRTERLMALGMQPSGKHGHGKSPTN